MISTKKIVSFSIKLLIGIISFYIIYKRLSSIPDFKQQCINWVNNPHVYIILLIVVLLMFLNWGIESLKWKKITEQIESIPYKTAVKSIFSGICVGNIAPGRAMEFLAKIVFFQTKNRPTITVLHFINGMFQMLITVLVGFVSITYKFSKTNVSSNFIYFIIGLSIILILFFIWCILNISYIQQKLKYIRWFKKMDSAEYISFSKKLVFQLITLSVIRYTVFTTQFYLVYSTLAPNIIFTDSFMSIAAYFMLTSLIPMISVIEPAIRAAIALFVFNNSMDNTATVVLASTLVWLINVVIPSIIGYIIIIQEKIDFNPKRAN